LLIAEYANWLFHAVGKRAKIPRGIFIEREIVSTAIRVLAISPRTLFRAGLGAILRGQSQIEVIGEVDDPRDAANFQFSIALLDAGSSRPKPNPFQFLVLLSEDKGARAWLDAGAAGVVLETALVEELLSAIHQVARGETFLPPSITKQVVASLAVRGVPREQPLEPLTDREHEVLGLLAQGLSNKDIAQKLYLSVRTVEGHLANTYGKLRVKSRTEAALWAVQPLGSSKSR
jgi:DNA-binding NarL/FixJ family response regulator